MLPSIINVILIIATFFIVKLLPIKNKNKLFLKLVFAEFFVILILREPISDMITYCQYYKIIGNLPWNALKSAVSWEYGFLILNKLLYSIWTNERFFIIVTTLLSLIGPYYFIKNYSKDYFLSCIFFIALSFFMYYYIILRQMIALSILLYSVKFIKDRKFIKFLLCVLFASLFHKSSAIFILAYFICNLNITFKYLIMWVILLFTSIPLKNTILQIFYLFGYSEYTQIVNRTDGYGLLTLMLLILISILAVITILYKQKIKITDESKIFFNLYFLAIFFQILATSQSAISRIVITFYMAIIILIPEVFKMIKNKELVLTLYVITLVCAIVLSIAYQNNLGEYRLYFRI